MKTTWWRIVFVWSLVGLAACEFQSAEPEAAPSEPSTQAGLGAPPRGQLRALTYNVHLLFDPHCDSGKCGYDDFEKAPSAVQYAARIREVADAIAYISPDVALLQEIENERVLTDLQAALAPDYPSAVMGEIGGAATIDTAVVSKLPVILVRRHRHQEIPLPNGEYTKFSREFLEVHLDAGGGQRVIVFSAHFRSKLNDNPDKRLAEAMAARQIVLASAQAFPDALVVMGGDLNDTPYSEPLAALEAGNRLVRPAAELQNGKDHTWGFRYGDSKAIDHFYIPSDRIDSYVDGSAVVFRAASGGLGGSDHGGLAARFWIPGK
jgi:endonuclease/exonuclease/phosphatase family metal-dependent hydrolase